MLKSLGTDTTRQKKRIQNNFFLQNEGQKRYGDHMKLLFNEDHSGD